MNMIMCFKNMFEKLWHPSVHLELTGGFSVHVYFIMMLLLVPSYGFAPCGQD